MATEAMVTIVSATEKRPKSAGPSTRGTRTARAISVTSSAVFPATLTRTALRRPVFAARWASGAGGGAGEAAS